MSEMEFLPAVERLRPRIVRYCRVVLRNDDDAEDATQEAILRAAHLWPEKVFENEDHVLRWFLRVARYECFALIREQKRAPSFSSFDKGDSPGEEYIDRKSTRLNDQSPHIERQSLARLDLEHTVVLLNKLPSTQRDALLLSAIGYTEFAIARMLHLSYDDALLHLRSGRAALRILEGEEFCAFILGKIAGGRARKGK